MSLLERDHYPENILEQIAALQRRLDDLERWAKTGNRTYIEVAAGDLVSDPPADAELDALLGTPGDVGTGFFTLLKTAAGLGYGVWTDGGFWYAQRFVDVASRAGLYWTGAGIDNTGETIIADGDLDITAVAAVMYAVEAETGGEVGGGVVTLSPGDAAVVCTDGAGTNTLELACAANGSLTLARSAGTDTYQAAVWVVWL